MKPMGEVKHNVQEYKMRTTKKELKKIIQEEYQKVLKEYISEGQPELEPESWYDKESPGDTGRGASFELGLFIVKLDKIQPGLGGELGSECQRGDLPPGAGSQIPGRGSGQRAGVHGGGRQVQP